MDCILWNVFLCYNAFELCQSRLWHQNVCMDVCYAVFNHMMVYICCRNQLALLILRRKVRRESVQVYVCRPVAPLETRWQMTLSRHFKPWQPLGVKWEDYLCLSSNGSNGLLGTQMVRPLSYSFDGYMDIDFMLTARGSRFCQVARTDCRQAKRLVCTTTNECTTLSFPQILNPLIFNVLVL